MSDQECADEGQPTDLDHWMTGGVLLDPSEGPSVALASADAAASYVLSHSGNSEHLPVASDSPGCYGDGSTESPDEADSSSADTDDEPLAKIAKMRKVASSSPGAKSPRKQRKATGPRAPTAYSLFVRENQPAIKSEHSSARPAEILRILRGIWKGMDAKARKPYTDASKIAKMEHKMQTAAMQHENADTGVANEQGFVPENNVLVTAALGPPFSAPMVLSPADALTDKPPLAKPSASGLGSATSGPRFIPATLLSTGFVEPEAVTSGTPLRNADSPYPVSRVLSLLRASPAAAAAVASTFSSPADAAAVSPDVQPGSSTVAASAGRAEDSAFAASSASSRPQQTYAVLTAQTAPLPADATLPSRTALHSAVSGQRDAVMTNGRTKIVIVAQQNNGMGSKAPHTIRLVTVGPQAVPPRPKEDQCHTDEPKHTTPSASTFQQPEPAHHAGQKNATGLGTSTMHVSLAADSASSGRIIFAGSSGSTLISGGASESLASGRSGRHPLTATIPRAAMNAAATDDRLSSMDSDFVMAAGLPDEHREHDVEMAEVAGSVDAAHSKAQTLLKTCHGCGRPKRNQSNADGDNPEALREQSKKLVQWSHENYCSSQCTVNHCRNVFNAWVSNRRLTMK